ncbi:cupin domain-containing protein [Pedobacter metabolipauper]|uniref:Quercetin dioxygenase-like cupin family protein n=1 Tax=Pedobacter metabolipauper TaxID=425513 RepID=A0A4V3D122_9SPHI|nr:cupin domain-containing protein [Pedobacter metabolipauper]TDQ08684.1 quercetin dioxygenase-like cupin family protein [Pedobacter metabolipauper]
MKTIILLNNFARLILVGVIVISITGSAKGQNAGDTTKSTPQIPRQGTGFFTGGNAIVKRIAASPEINSGVANVTFPAGVRTIWHAHAGGQIIVVVSGTAWYQEKGKPKQVIPQGEAVVCPPGVMHWHGATLDAPMSHTVATPNLDKGGVTAGSAVSDQEYKALK